MAVFESGTKCKMSLLEALKEESKPQHWRMLNSSDTPQSLEQKDLCTSPQITGDYTWKWKEGLADRFVGFAIPPAGSSNIRAVIAVWEGSGQTTDGI